MSARDNAEELFEPDWLDVCADCDGEGYALADCFEDTCCCANPELEHGMIRCPTCGGNP